MNDEQLELILVELRGIREASSRIRAALEARPGARVVESSEDPLELSRTLRSARKRWNELFHERFWPAYPRRVAKGQAIKAWSGLYARHVEPSKGDRQQRVDEVADSVEIMLDWYKAKPWKGRPNNGTDFPYPASWLNSETFDDERVREVLT